MSTDTFNEDTMNEVLVATTDEEELAIGAAATGTDIASITDTTNHKTNSDDTVIDVSLLRGLEPIMSKTEQSHLTSMLISGDPNDLAKAAKIFHDLGLMLQKGITSYSKRTADDQKKMAESFHGCSFVAAPRRPRHTRLGYNDYEERVLEEKKQADEDKKERATALPLPVRMPRLVVLDAFDPDGTTVTRSNRLVKGIVGGTKTQKPSLTFVDHEWDGSLGMAFTKVTVKDDKAAGGVASRLKTIVRRTNSSSGEPVHVESDLKPTPGFDEIVLPGRGYDAKLVEEVEPIVLVASTHNDASKLAIHRGDVVTHVNGTEFVGTASDLNNLIKAHYESIIDPDAEEGGAVTTTTHPRQLEIVVNAELCIAQALKLRAAVSC